MGAADRLLGQEDVALNNVKATSNYWFNDNLDAGNPAVGIRCVKNYKVKK